ncbi:hypothetical protein [Hyalangium rubrum]|uniref:Uncharacterized protein n=1 Tax=Hyalangium rubrum TaxID=3103134 RepID=A0ABU5H0Z8_9BACT|nr:hypothetical protein [Hyalangium sp. s54d21]MDY7227119.1 hypothetical protein [Hyalangium sp. s54d21]
MASDEPSYLKAAFLNIYNLSMLGGALTASALTGEYVLGAVALGVEALWLLFGPDLRPFQRAVREGHRKEQEAADRERVDKMLKELPQQDWQRAKALDELRRDIERDMANNPSFQAILLQTELDKLRHLHQSFVALALACNRAESYMAAVDPRQLKREMEAQTQLEKTLKDPAAQAIARKNLQVLAKREETIQEIQNFLMRARGQMNLIENSVRLLRDQALTMASPGQLGEQLDDLLTGVDAIQATAKDHADVLGSSVMEPLAEVVHPAPVAEGAHAPAKRGRNRS